MKRYIYWFSVDEDKEIPVEGTSLESEGAVLVVKDGEEEVARYVKANIQVPTNVKDRWPIRTVRPDLAWIA